MAGPTITAKFVADTAQMTGEVNKATDSMAGSLGSFAKKAALAIGAAFVIDKVVDFGKASVEVALAAEKSQKLLAGTLRNVTHATDEQIASTEKYLGALSKQTALSKGELRPALDSLVRGFDNVDEAQKALALAADISAGTGKDLATVALALQKAANGSVGGLQRLGVETKDAAGKTKSLDQIMKDLSTTFSGQAATAAGTAAGKMRLAEIAFAGFQKQVGERLIPVVAFFAEVITGTILPAIDQLFNAFTGSAAFQTFSAFITGTLIPAVLTAAQAFQAFAQPIVTDFLNNVLVPAIQTAITWLSQIASPAVAAFFTNTLVPALQTTAEWLAALIIPALLTFWETGLQPAIAAVSSLVTDTLIPAFSDLFGALQDSGVFQGIADAMGTAIPLLSDVASTITGKVIPAVADFLGAFVNNAVVPVLKDIAKLIGQTVVPTVLDFWRDGLKPAFDSVAKVLTETLIPALKDLVSNITNTGVYQAFVAVLTAVVPVIGSVATIVAGTLIPALAGLVGFLASNGNVVISILTAIAAVLIGPVLISFVSLIPTAVGLFGIWVAGAIAAAAATIAAAAPFVLIGAAIAALVFLVVNNWDTIVNATKVAFEFVKNAVETAFNWIKENWPLLLAIITGPIGIAVLLITKNWDTIKAGATAVWQWIQDKWNAIQEAIANAIAGIRSHIDTLLRIWDSVKEAATAVFNWVKEKFDAMVDAIRNVIGGVRSAVDAVVNAIKAPINAVIRLWNNLAFTVPSISIPEVDLGPLGKIGGGTFGGFTIDFPDLPTLAKGGVLTDPTLFIGGEAGTEIVAPEAMLRSIVAEESQGGNYTLNLYPRTADAADVAYGFRRLELLAGLP